MIVVGSKVAKEGGYHGLYIFDLFPFIVFPSSGTALVHFLAFGLSPQKYPSDPVATLHPGKPAQSILPQFEQQLKISLTTCWPLLEPPQANCLS